MYVLMVVVYMVAFLSRNGGSVCCPVWNRLFGLFYRPSKRHLQVSDEVMPVEVVIGKGTSLVWVWG